MKPTPRLLRTLLLPLLFLHLFQGVPRAATHRYALSVFHFNLQYVAGGLIGLFPFPFEPWEVNEEVVEDAIILESFEPVLDLYLAHPTWGTNLEMQAYFIEVLADRHPQVLQKLRTLAVSGQAEVVSFHYSDQLYLAYPSVDLEHSLEQTRRVFDEHGIPLSATVFCQEGQASPAMDTLMERFGYTLVVWPKNLYRYQRGDAESYMPLYRLGSRWMVVGPGSVDYAQGDTSIQVRWTFLDDGELLATGDWDPYFPPFFVHDPAAVAAYEEELTAMERNGYAIATLGRYLEDILQLDISPADPGPLLEGTWQPQSTDGIFRWLGDAGLFGRTERDNHVRTLCAAAHREILAAETMATALDRTGRGDPAAREQIDEAWRLLSLAQVSDATGINPFVGEVEYGIAHAAESLRIARDLIQRGKGRLGLSAATIDTLRREVRPGGRATDPGTPVPSGPVQVEVDAPGREVDLEWTTPNDPPARHRLDIRFSAGAGEASRRMRVSFPGEQDSIVYCPSLDEQNPVVWRREDFEWEHFVLPLPNGMIGLGGDRYVIKDTAVVHVGAFLYEDRPEVAFRDETAPPGEPVTWTFHIMEGTLEDAVAFANRLNVWPRLQR